MNDVPEIPSHDSTGVRRNRATLKTSSDPVSTIKPRIDMVLQGKGGIHKSFVASVITQYRQHAGQTVHAFDTDPVNETMLSIPGLHAEAAGIVDGDALDIEKTDAFIERLLQTDGHIVIDNGSASFLPISLYLIENGISEVLETAGRDLVLHVVLTGGQAMVDTLRGWDALIRDFPAGARFVVWKNEFWGPVSAGGVPLEEMQGYRKAEDRVIGIVQLRELNTKTFGANLRKMLAMKLTFAEALAPEGSPFNTVERQRLTMIRRELFDQLAAVL
jgi:hypothetical protein